MFHKIDQILEVKIAQFGTEMDAQACNVSYLLKLPDLPGKDAGILLLQLLDEADHL